MISEKIFQLAIGIVAILLTAVGCGGPGGTPTPTLLPTTDISVFVGIGRTMTRERDGAVMVYVPGGTFQMGATDKDAEYASRLCPGWLKW